MDDESNVSAFPPERLIHWSIRRLADELRMDRPALSRRLKEAGLKPSRQWHGHPQYRLREACEVIFQQSGIVADPRELKPLDRRAWYQSERERMRLLEEAGLLIPAGEVEATYAELVRSFVGFLVALPDQLERRVGLPPEYVEALHFEIDAQRDALYRSLADAFASASPDDEDQPEGEAS